MKNAKPFFSLKWKLSLSIGFILVLFYSIYSYYIYEQTTQNFRNSRQSTQQEQIDIARALTNESFFVLERFAESILVAADESSSRKQSIAQLFDSYWTHWQIIWGLEGANLYSKNNTILKQWGKGSIVPKALLQTAFSEESPQHQIECSNGCFQQIIIPALSNSKTTQILSLSVSLSDTLLQYQNTVHSHLGLLINEHDPQLSAVTNAKQNIPLWLQLRKNNNLASFTNTAIEITYNTIRYEIRAFSINNDQQAPYYIAINDINNEYKELQKKLVHLAAAGVIGLFLIILFLYITLHLSLSSVRLISSALPLLAHKKYTAFQQKLNQSTTPYFADEMSVLTESASQVSQQLNLLEIKSKASTHLLLQNSAELTQQRDFMEQLIETAPIIIITQSVNGNILSINKEALQKFELPLAQAINKPFSDFIPHDESDHLRRLEQLTHTLNHSEISYSGRLNLINTGSTLYISWIHSIIYAEDPDQDTVILSLGVDVTEQHVADEQLLWTATHDQLTGLSNRRNFQQELDSMLAITERYKTQLALFYLDLDQFKVINDTHGHQAGDELLQQIANILKQEIRESDLLSRIGGDEFTLVVPSATIEGVKILADKLLLALKQIKYTINGQAHPISFSIGISIYPLHGTNQQELLANADLAMYHAKKTGRSRSHIFSPGFEYQAVLTEQLHWKNIIESAVKQDQFLLFYQPILDIKQKKISHYECLLRIELEDGKILMPGDFIIQAEQLGIIDQIDRLVLNKAIEQHLAFQKIGNNARLAINLSGRSMNDESILPYIEKLLNQENVKPELIIFEITETSAVSNFLSAKSMIKKLKALGCRFALDDFGVGFSSFYYLKSLPVDYVKIDGSFVKHMDTNQEDRVFVKVLTEVSQTFGKKIIAEFVENQAILQLLDELGVDYAQGYYVSKPIRDPLDLGHVKGLE